MKRGCSHLDLVIGVLQNDRRQVDHGCDTCATRQQPCTGLTSLKICCMDPNCISSQRGPHLSEIPQEPDPEEGQSHVSLLV